MSFDAGRGDAPKADDRSNSSEDFLQRAARAVDAGDAILGVHLYLAAFERALNESIVPSYDSLEGMEAAWRIAIDAKQRSLAEYIFERLEPYLSEDAAARHAVALQKLAFDTLEDLGFPREAIEGMADLVGQEFSDAPNEEDMGNVDAALSFMGFDLTGDNGLSGLVSKRIEDRGGNVSPEDADLPDQSVPTDALRASQEDLRRRIAETLGGTADDADSADKVGASASASQKPEGKKPSVRFSQIVIPSKDKAEKQPQWFGYQDLCGYSDVIRTMEQLGIGHQNDAGYRNFVKMLNERHGLDCPPSLGTLMFVSDAREDTNYFMAATAGELRVPAVRMRFDRNAAGQTVLVVMASPDFPGRLNQIARHGFSGSAAVILEDMDLWQVPELDLQMDEMSMSNLMQMQVSRGAREAMAFLSVALATPEVTVMASCADVNAMDPYFRDLLGMYTPVEIAFPNEFDRRELWRKAQAEHPSLRGLDIFQLVECSKGLTRYDIYEVAKEAVENAYRESLTRQRFCAVQASDMLMRLSAFHPLDSKEYLNMESVLMSELKGSLDGGIDSLLGGR